MRCFAYCVVELFIIYQIVANAEWVNIADESTERLYKSFLRKIVICKIPC